MTQSEKLLRELIAIPSVNPAFVPAGDPNAGEERVAEFLAAEARKAGLEIERQRVFPGRANVLARLLPKQKSAQRILLAPHLDTVGVSDEKSFGPRAKNGRLYGRGACDTKGNVAMMLAALVFLARSRRRPSHTEIVFAGLVDEENGQTGSRVLAASKFKADLAIVGEPTELRVVTAHKGDLWLELEAQGKSAHGARPELGRNAVHAMAKIVDLLETDYAAQLRRRRHPLLGYPTVNVGSIAGGTQPNIVPARCAISIDRRTLPGETELTVRREIRALLRRRRQKASFRNVKAAECLPMETSFDLPLVRQFLSSVGQQQPAGVDFFCDASVLSAGGIPSVVFGAGNIAQAHTADEWISLRSLESGTRFLTRFLESLP
ncbi:MAG: M20/M25/M40 family metallo-hydrolase [Verrucomicrobia bacterium]|nr:M20/M25/M40 family metallo-hydrolase [Verrucomicrobiota bacterium]